MVCSLLCRALCFPFTTYSSIAASKLLSHFPHLSLFFRQSHFSPGLDFFHFGLRTQNFQKNGLACRILKFDDKKCRILQIYDTKCRILQIYGKKCRNSAFRVIYNLFMFFVYISPNKSALASEASLGLWGQSGPLRPALASEASLRLWGQPRASEASLDLWGQPGPLRPAWASEASLGLRVQPRPLRPALTSEASLGLLRPA